MATFEDINNQVQWHEGSIASATTQLRAMHIALEDRLYDGITPQDISIGVGDAVYDVLQEGAYARLGERRKDSIRIERWFDTPGAVVALAKERSGHFSGGPAYMAANHIRRRNWLPGQLARRALKLAELTKKDSHLEIAYIEKPQDDQDDFFERARATLRDKQSGKQKFKFHQTLGEDDLKALDRPSLYNKGVATTATRRLTEHFAAPENPRPKTSEAWDEMETQQIVLSVQQRVDALRQKRTELIEPFRLVLGAIHKGVAVHPLQPLHTGLIY